MSGISKKLLKVIGEQSAKSWAEQNGLPVQTVHEWLKHDRMPRGANLQLLINATGIAKEWWVSSSDSPPPSPPSNTWTQQTTTCPPRINKSLLHACIEACKHFYGSDFRSSPEQVQISYAADCYNAVIAMVQDNSPSPANSAQLTKEDIGHLMKIAIKLGKLHNFTKT